MKLDKRQFCIAVDTYKSMLKELEEIENAIGGELRVPTDWIDSYYDLVTDLCELEDDPYVGTDLDWFCFETDFGSKKDYCKIYDKETGRTWTIETPEILYDFITREW
jgi:hypothetical protein